MDVNICWLLIAQIVELKVVGLNPELYEVGALNCTFLNWNEIPAHTTPFALASESHFFETKRDYSLNINSL